MKADRTWEGCDFNVCALEVKGYVVVHNIPNETGNLRCIWVNHREPNDDDLKLASPPPVAYSSDTKYGKDLLTSSNVACDT